MTLTFFELIDTTFDFPQEGFELTEKGTLAFWGMDLMDIIEEFGTPARLFYLPRIEEQIGRARSWFKKAFKQHGYRGDYIYCYCTKSNHFSFVVEKALQAGAHLECSYTADLDIVLALHRKGLITTDTYIICNGYKPHPYTEKIKQLWQMGFRNLIAVLDSEEEIEHYRDIDLPWSVPIGIRMAAEEEPTFEFYTSRMGIPPGKVIPLAEEKILPDKRFNLVMLHFFINTGISDSPYYWSEFDRALTLYIELGRRVPALCMFNIGGGFPVPNSLRFDYDYEDIIDEIVSQIKQRCDQYHLPHPTIFSEFGTFTVGESGAYLFTVLGEKIQNDAEHWYIINSSIMTTLPDAWGLGMRFIVLPINGWDRPFKRVNIGGLSCDSYDYYNAEVHLNNIYLPILSRDEPLHIGFFNCGAYQDALSGWGGLKHCLIPAPQVLVADRDRHGKLHIKRFAPHQSTSQLLTLLGYQLHPQQENTHTLNKSHPNH